MSYQPEVTESEESSESEPEEYVPEEKNKPKKSAPLKKTLLNKAKKSKQILSSDESSEEDDEEEDKEKSKEKDKIIEVLYFYCQCPVAFIVQNIFTPIVTQLKSSANKKILSLRIQQQKYTMNNATYSLVQCSLKWIKQVCLLGQELQLPPNSSFKSSVVA